jgi:hypothetical protein
MHYKYKILHIPSGNIIGVCYDKNNEIPKSYRVSKWLCDANNNPENLDMVPTYETGILGFFMSDLMFRDCAGNGENEVKTFTHTNKHSLNALINNFNFRFDIAMDLYDITYRGEMSDKVSNEGLTIIPSPIEFEIIKVK